MVNNIVIKNYFKKIMVLATIVTTIIVLDPIGAEAEWKYDKNGSWYTEGNSYATGWRLIDGNWYYFYSNGYMAHDTIIDGYYLNSNGVWNKDSYELGDINTEDGIYDVHVKNAFATQDGEYVLEYKTMHRYCVDINYAMKVNYDGNRYFQMNYPIVEINGKNSDQRKITIDELMSKVNIGKEEVISLLCSAMDDDATGEYMMMSYLTTEHTKFNSNCKIELGGTMLGKIFDRNAKKINSSKELTNRINEEANRYVNPSQKGEEVRYMRYITIEVKNNEIVKFVERYHP